MLTKSQGSSELQGGRVVRHTFRAPLIPVLALGLASSLFLAISFILCVLSYLLFPSLPVAHGAISLVLPGFQFLTFQSFLLGLVESFGWGWYVSLIFGPLYNYFASRFSRAPA
jgi:hypothetical protein